MQARNLLIRILKLLGKASVGLLLVFLTQIILLHLPFVQQKITPALSEYLSEKIGARVEIKRVSFSLTGSIGIAGLAVWDPDEKQIFTAQQIKVSTGIIDLISGNLIFDEVKLEGVWARLVQSESGLNIQYILDAFQPKTTNPPPAESRPVVIQFNKVSLESIDFEFTSSVSETDVSVNLGTFNCEGTELTTNPMKIIADKVSLAGTAVKVLTTTHPEVANDTIAAVSSTQLTPDFGTGIIFEVNDVDLKDNDFSFHRNGEAVTQKFDPSHLVLKDIDINLSEITIHKDTLTATLRNLSAASPGLKIESAGADVHMNRELCLLSGLHLSTGTSNLHADITGPYNVNSILSGNNAAASVSAQATIDVRDIAYFLTDSIMRYFNNWQNAGIEVEAQYRDRTGEIETLNVKTGNSQFHTQGLVSEVLDLEKLSWKDIVVHATVGPDFKTMLASLLPEINMPPNATLQLTSNGNLNRLSVDGKAFTSWGDATVIGAATRLLDAVGIDMKLTADRTDLGKWMNVTWIGPVDLSASVKGSIRNNRDIEIDGKISTIELLDQSIHQIDLNGSIKESNITAILSIDDPDYRSEITSEISFAGPLRITTGLKAEHFNLGELLQLDSTLTISGNLKSKIEVDQSTINGTVEGSSILFQNHSLKYALDTVAILAATSPAGSVFNYYTKDGKASFVSNFDIRQIPDVIRDWSSKILTGADAGDHPVDGKRVLQFDVQLPSAIPFQLLGIDVTEFSSLNVEGALNEEKQTASLQATSGHFKGYGIALDTLSASMISNGDSARADVNARNLLYQSTLLGNLDAGLYTRGDTTVSSLMLSDSIVVLKLGARILPVDSGLRIYPDKLQVYEYEYSIDRNNPLYLKKGNVSFDNFQITSKDMLISLDGDKRAFDINLKNVDLTQLNLLLSRDTVTINSGRLNGVISYAEDQQLNLKAKIDSLVLYNSNPLVIEVAAVREVDQIPFEFHLSNTGNKIDLDGHYLTRNSTVDASLKLDVNNLELFAFLLSDAFTKMHGALKGESKIQGPLQRPSFNGRLQLLDATFTTVNPELTFNVKDDLITLDGSSILLDNFRLYDQQDNPLTIDGKVNSSDFRSFDYDLKIKTDQYALINRPDSANGQLKGLLIIATDVKLTGNQKDTNVEARVTVKDSTNLTYVVASDDIELLKSEGIVDFIDPSLLLDSVGHDATGYFYDSLIASLPDFNLNSTVTIDDRALIRILIDEQSGDYLEASGAGNLDLDYDRTGNVHLSGNYTIKKGVYRVSFYDLVRKNFALVPGSSINFSGSPENGDLDIKAVYTVSTNSIGLIGHEIGENEKSIYKRALEYAVGINIKGTVESPIVSFSLDLPQEEKVNYPVLSNKLDRLRQPEFESELNKQVFGLLVLGGFLPETSGSDFNQNLIATTALSNSVNSLLASQLNRFASQYIKGLNIDVGIQSYSDYATGGGKTRTAMDFRVSKQIMNDRLSFEVGGDFDVNQDQSGANTGNNFRGDMAIIYDLTGNGDKKIKVFNNETYDIIYQEIRNTGISLVFIREFDKSKNANKGNK